MKHLLSVAILALFITTVLGSYSESQYQLGFTSWMQVHQKTYHHTHFMNKYLTWRKNLDYIEAHNKAHPHMFLAMNEFGDLSHEEFQKQYLGIASETKEFKKMKMRQRMLGQPASYDNVADMPTEWNWADKGAVTPVKNQGQCGSCWAFSTTGSVEGCHFLESGKLVSLSEQQLVDCSTANSGCRGGLMDSAFAYIKKNGIVAESDYPYTAQDGRCKFNAAQAIAANVTGYIDIPEGSEKSLQVALFKRPVSVAIDASQMSFQFYSSGVYYDANCSSEDLDHGVLAVGWGTDPVSKSDYWIVKNSWGATWGQKGYILMRRNYNNHCGIATMASYPTC